MYYRRSEQAKDKDKSGSSGSSKSARIETTVIFLPDTSSIMPNHVEWEDVQSHYKEALQSFLASKEQPATVSVDDDDGTKEIPIITISDDNDVAMEVADADDDKTSVKNAVADEVLALPVSDVVAVDDGETKEAETETAAAVVVNPDSSITDKALTDNNQTEDYKFNFPNHFLLSHSFHPSLYCLDLQSISIHSLKLSFNINSKTSGL